LGASFYQTPRDASKAFVGFLSLLEQNPGTDWRSLLGDVPIEPSSGGEADGRDDELARFTLI
jgi:hypothetical protein